MKTIAKNANDFADLRTADGGNCGTWTATGRPSMLMNFIKREGLQAIDYENGVTARENDFDVTDNRNLRAVAMLYQTGCLTIKDYRRGRYLLGVPDEEVRRDLLLLVAAQIREKGYEKPYLADGRPVYLIGLAFDSKTRQLADAAWERGAAL